MVLLCNNIILIIYSSTNNIVNYILIINVINKLFTFKKELVSQITYPTFNNVFVILNILIK